jgi:hypothetical protein
VKIDQITLDGVIYAFYRTTAIHYFSFRWADLKDPPGFCENYRWDQFLRFAEMNGLEQIHLPDIVATAVVRPMKQSLAFLISRFRPKSVQHSPSQNRLGLI